MARLTQTDPAKIISLTSEYSTPYNAVIRDNIIMGVPRYFLERWVPILGTDPATLVNTLRQLDYRSHHNTVIISGEALAQEAAMSRRHLYTCLQTPWVAAFVRLNSGQRIQTEDGKIVQQANRYFARMDDPLIPADAEHLFSVLLNLADTPLQAAEKALELEPRALWASQVTDPAGHFTAHRAITAQDVLRRAFPTWQPVHDGQQQAFVQLAEALHRHITLVRTDGRTSKVIVPQYFRYKWWKRLGHELAWAYLWLRGCVYDNPNEGIRRDTCWVPSLNTLLALIGRPREWWRRHVEHATPQPGGWSVADFFQQINAEKGRDPAHPQWVARQFRVALEIPIDPDDQQTYIELLNDWPDTKPAAQPIQNMPVNDVSGSTGPVAPASQTSEVCHTETHRSSEGLPQPHTPEQTGSATTAHTGTNGVCHTDAQGSATPMHSNIALDKAQELPNQSRSTSSNTPPNPPQPGNELAAAGKRLGNIPRKKSLTDLLAAVLDQQPNTPLYLCVDVSTWLRLTWPEPIRPYTPAWKRVVTGKIPARDLVALILAVWADPSVNQPPRYLSWLIQSWQSFTGTEPVDHWDTWCALAELPLTEWFEVGRKHWVELVSPKKRSLPFGLDTLALACESDPVPQPPIHPPDLPTLPPPGAPAQNGLDERPGSGQMTIKQLWALTLAQLRGQLTEVIYTTWVFGANAVAYANGILTVEARHSGARDWLVERLASSIERILSELAQQPIKVCYTAPPDNLFLADSEPPDIPPA